jgi:dTDP-4-dehydrorhamnose reductase
MRVCIIGADGQLGSDLVKACIGAKHEVSKLVYADMHVEDIESVRTVIRGLNPHVVLNTAAFHNVPKCEEMPSQAFAVNAVGAYNVARVSEELHCVNVYYSTDYVFDGRKGSPYVETDAAHPLNIYAISKLAGEQLTLEYCRTGIVIRISGIYGTIPSIMKGDNFITMMLRIAKEKPEVKVVNDEILSPTPTAEIAEKTLNILQSGESGLFHLTSEGFCSWYEFTRVIFETLNIKTPLLMCSVSDFPSTVKRPSYSVLENARYNALGRFPQMRHWRDALIDFLKAKYI